MATRAGGAGGYVHYQKCQKLGIKRLPCAIVLGCPPLVAFVAPQKMPVGVDEISIAGGLAGAPINVVRAHSVDLLVSDSQLGEDGSSSIICHNTRLLTEQFQYTHWKRFK